MTPEQEAAVQRARQKAAIEKAATVVNSGREVIAKTKDGEIYRLPSGTMGYTSPGYATTDPAKVEELLKGATPVEIVQRDVDQQRIAENPIAARANEVVRGVPFVGSYADEAVGMVSPNARDNMRATTEAMQREKPGQTAALNIGGAIAGAVPMALAAGPTIAANAGATTGAQALQAGALGLTAGGVEGAVYGAGEGTGEERKANAKTGAAIGAGAGLIVGAAAPYAAKGIQAVLGRLQNSDVATISTQLGISRRAAVVVKNALDAGDMNEAVAAMQRAGDDAMLADAGGPARDLLDASAAAGGNAGAIARKAVEGRVTDASERMAAALDATLGAPKGSQELVDGIRTGTAQARQSAYDAAYAAPIDYSSNTGRSIESLLNRVPASAIRRAQELMRLEGVESKQILAKIDGDTVTFETMPDVRQLDYITRALNDVAANADGAGKLGGTTDLGRATSNLSRAIRSRVKDAVPEYKTALDVASDAITERNAVDLGYNLFRANTKREDVARAISGASKAEKEAAKQGLRSAIDDATANVARTITDPNVDAREGIKVLRDFSSRANQSKLTMILGKKEADKLLGEIDQAATAFELRAAIATNSKTAMRQSIQGGIDQQSSQGLVRTLAAGEPVNAGKRFVQALTGETAEAQELRRLGLYEEIATALTQTRGQQAQRALKLIEQAMNGQRQISKSQAEFIASTLSGASLAADRATSTLLSR